MTPTRPPPETFARVFAPCAHCHQIGDGARATSGPVLTDIVGRRAARTDYPYSQAMIRSGLTWDDTTLRRFLAKPSDVVPGTRMFFKGLQHDEIDPLIEFLKKPNLDENG
ncbi:c-type cytochrome [Microvirga arabica]|nr:c-type cytochrome [Microvirga arabica]